MNKQILNIIICCILLAASPLYAGDIFKCIDKNGNVKFSDKPCDPDKETTIIIPHEDQYSDNINLEAETESDTETTETAEPETLKLLQEKQPDKSVEYPEVTNSETDIKASEDTEPESLPQEPELEYTEEYPEAVSQEQADITTADSENTEPDSSKALSGKMSIQDFIDSLGRVNPYLLLSLFAFPLLAVVLIGRMHKKWYGNMSPWQYIYSFFVYSVCIPGMFACVLIFYSLFFIEQNLLTVNIFIYFLPVVSMVATLALINRNAVLSKLPGVDQLFALMTILFISFSAAFALQRTRIWIFFGGSFISLIVITLILFIILKLSMNKLFRQK
ncbi:MAG: DUF4124 domain-containing protein [Desulfobacteraceae bacterium]|nr:DUF4124 domain-containing protein [Desulfobacteraceae bacterium]